MHHLFYKSPNNPFHGEERCCCLSGLEMGWELELEPEVLELALELGLSWDLELVLKGGLGPSHGQTSSMNLALLALGCSSAQIRLYC